MVQAHYLTEEERDSAAEVPLSFESKAAAPAGDGKTTEEDGDPETPRELDLSESGG
jgi:hypothetical protein